MTSLDELFCGFLWSFVLNPMAAKSAECRRLRLFDALLSYKFVYIALFMTHPNVNEIWPQRPTPILQPRLKQR